VSSCWALEPQINREDVAGLCEQFRGWLQDQVGVAVVCDVSAIVDPDVVIVDVLARLQLSALRVGRRIRIEGACRQLAELLAVTGLGELFSAPD
jgi:ABC-type transporter Mla MlaB component